MKKDVENEIEELLEQIENKYQNHNNSSLLDYVVSIIKKLNIVKIFSSILIIILSILMNLLFFFIKVFIGNISATYL